ncbi:response regulator [Belliella sp. R4-6]|uniref:Response regulator n=1 Tax=Belliella alkalica TaxID=1730871 RepID=A0ABS9V776_9BACT|nr:response regulator [Belliella alkalica]MCH7412264.1 response regulator [Belliella alkalica]
MKYDILIVDDEEIIIKLVKHLVIKSGLHSNPKGFIGGIDALEYLNALNNSNTTQIILLDINMPNFDGWDFLGILEKSQINVPIHVIIITSSINKSDKEKASLFKMVSSYIEKPVSMQNMEQIKELKFLKSLSENY